MLVVHHVTYSINSLCHFFGRRRFETDDHSRNLLWLAPFTFGESWHNNHHAFPTSASHGMSRWPVDPSWLVIRAMEAPRPRLGRRPGRSDPDREEGGRYGPLSSRAAAACSAAGSAFSPLSGALSGSGVSPRASTSGWIRSSGSGKTIVDAWFELMSVSACR